MDKIELIMFAGLSGFIFYLFIYMLKRDKVVDSKLAGIELSLEEINQEIFKLKKTLNSINVEKTVEEIEIVIEKLVSNIKKIEENNIKRIKELENKIFSIKSSVKPTNVDYVNVNESDKIKILNMYRSGYSIEEISKELRIPAGQIDLVIKFQNF